MTKIKSADDLSEKILAPLIKYCSENRGALSRIAELFNNGNSKSVRLSHVQKWLAADRKKSVPPNAGNLLRLGEAWAELRGPAVENNPQPKMFCAFNGCDGVQVDGVIKCKICERLL